MPDVAVDQFLAAGFTREQVLEVVAGVSVKTLSNYANHLLKTPVDPQFATGDMAPAGRRVTMGESAQSGAPTPNLRRNSPCCDRP